MKLTENQISKLILDSAFEIYFKLGPGLLESIYERILAIELRKKGLLVETQVPISVNWKGVEVGIGYRGDLLVNDLVLIELKSVENVLPVHAKQLKTYLKILDLRLGLLINFNEIG
ncbi:GxxExxY protein [Algoriphagus hitonicola]|uniref:GxxExxY protein n=1 Tax=Algoriphagus hitonicola TaxID=435880 RepID=A0A1I2XL40_9BACT|nr:GxxExxY protein [Algoriphagus hitonicola]SFH14160.1 GxxExxY protein [Algoriphagus hitonicola]